MLDDIKKTLWATADKLRANMDAAEYKHLVLGLIFLKYISDNLNLLAEALGLSELELVRTEHPAGNFKIDILWGWRSIFA